MTNIPSDSARLKRPSCNLDTPPDSLVSKRARTRSNCDLDGYSKAELYILEGAASILKVSLPVLLATGTAPAASPTSEGLDSFTGSFSMSANLTGGKGPDAPEEEEQQGTSLPEREPVPFTLHLPESSTRNEKKRALTEEAPVTPVDSWMQEVLDGIMLQTPEHDAGEFFFKFPSPGSQHVTLEGESSGTSRDVYRPPGSQHTLLEGESSATNRDIYRPENPLVRTFHGAEPGALGTVELDSATAALEAMSALDGGVSVNDSTTVAGSSLAASPAQSRKVRGRFTDQGLRQETSMTRRIGACITCAMQRIRCNSDPASPNGICKTCQTGNRMHWFPCLRYRITEAQLLDHGECPRPAWTLRWKKMKIVEIRDWASPEIKTVTITQDVAGLSYDVKMRRFKPKPGDSLARRWKTDGIEQSYECTPYGIANMRETGRTLADFVDRTLEAQLCYYIDESDGLLRKTYMMAHRYMCSLAEEHKEEKFLLKSVLRLWCASRMESRSDRICSEETLGMEPKFYSPRCLNEGLILTSPVFSAQIEVIMTDLLLIPAKKDVLKMLKKLVEQNLRRSWFTLYLTIFILLHSCALLTASDRKKALKQGLQGCFFRPSLMEELHGGANNLLAHFHYCVKGGSPLAMDWSTSDQLAWTEFDKEQIQFMLETRKEVNARADIFRQVKKDQNVDHEYYFLSQLYDTAWTPFPLV